MANDDWLEEALRRDAAQRVPDEGFTERVLRALPSTRASRPWVKPALILGGAAAGSLLALLLSPLDALLGAGLLDLARLRPTPEVAVVLAMSVVLAVSAWVVATDE